MPEDRREILLRLQQQKHAPAGMDFSNYPAGPPKAKVTATAQNKPVVAQNKPITTQTRRSKMGMMKFGNSQNLGLPSSGIEGSQQLSSGIVVSGTPPSTVSIEEPRPTNNSAGP